MAPEITQNGSTAIHPESNGQKAPVQADAQPFIMPKPPKFESLEKERTHRLEKLAAAFRIFGKLGFDEGVAGHLTVRDPVKTDHFWVNPFGLPFAHMTVSDLLLINPSGEIVDGGKPELQFYNTAAFAIHHQIHLARPDVDAACHSHSIYGKAFSTLGKSLDITTQDACVFHDHISLYSDFGGVVVGAEEGRRIAKSLGSNKAVILQNHGILTVGKTIESAVAWFIMLERACQVNLLSDAAGAGGSHKPIKIRDEEARFTFEATGTETAGWFIGQPYFAVVERESGGAHKQ